MKAGSARLLTGKIKHLDFSVDDWRPRLPRFPPLISRRISGAWRDWR
jgi:hypothetical protein